MYRVDVYIETDKKTFVKMPRRVIYLLTLKGKEYRKGAAMRVDATYNGAILQGMGVALRRILKPSEVHLHTQNDFVLEMIQLWLKDWEKRGFCRADGKPLRNQAEWEFYWEQQKGHLIVPEKGLHPYLALLTEEIHKNEPFGIPVGLIDGVVENI